MKILISIILLVSITFANNIGKITSIKGSSFVKRDSQQIATTVGFKLEEKDIIETSKNSKVQIIFNDNTIVTIGKLSTFNIDEYLYDEQKPLKSKVNFKFLKGSFKSITGIIGKVNPNKLSDQ